MSDSIIKVENVSKLYQLGSIGTGTLSQDFQRWWATVRGKEDPFMKIGQINDRTKKSENDFVWALQDINFEVKKGEVLGIIGRNGAGKSTLLKILSKITSPTTGKIYVGGRIASLLEVGTGFHPEMTGRDNIFMNGAILGMKKAEIKSKFDEIVEFAGVEAYIDTPVKRYSSGMYVRLAFAVAAFLEPEILIVDEVLAVGDAEFQKKCLGRMRDVSVNDGRTVLFVSHNIAAIENLCTRALLMDRGLLVENGPVSGVIDRYLKKYSLEEAPTDLKEMKRAGNKSLQFEKIYLSQFGVDNVTNIESLQDVSINCFFKVESGTVIRSGRIDIGINDIFGTRIAWMSTSLFDHQLSPEHTCVRFDIKKLNLAPGYYNCNIYAEINGEVSDHIVGTMGFHVIEMDYFKSGRSVPKNQGNFLIWFESNLS